jgi:hypothetical protein
MLFEVVSTVTWNVLGTFSDEDEAREAVRSLLSDQECLDAHDLVVYASDDSGGPVAEFVNAELVDWVAAEGSPGASSNPVLAILG